MKYLRTLIFGERAVGEKLAPPTVKTSYPDKQPDDFNEWISSALNYLRSEKKVRYDKKKVVYSLEKA